jgi:hypothetical protein
VIDIVAPGLNDKNVLITDRFRDFDVYFAIGEWFDCTRRERDIKPDRQALAMDSGSKGTGCTARRQLERAQGGYSLKIS